MIGEIASSNAIVQLRQLIRQAHALVHERLPTRAALRSRAHSINEKQYPERLLPIRASRVS